MKGGKERGEGREGGGGEWIVRGRGREGRWEGGRAGG